MPTLTKPLTARQSEILGIIKERIKAGRSPTVRELMARTGIRSPNGIVCHLKALEKKGVIERDANVACGIRIPGVAETAATGPQWLDRPTTAGVYLIIKKPFDIIGPYVACYLEQEAIDAGAPFHAHAVMGPFAEHPMFKEQH